MLDRHESNPVTGFLPDFFRFHRPFAAENSLERIGPLRPPPPDNDATLRAQELIALIPG